MHFVVVSAALTWFVSMFQNVYKQKPRPSQEFFYGFDLSCKMGGQNFFKKSAPCARKYPTFTSFLIFFGGCRHIDSGMEVVNMSPFLEGGEGSKLFFKGGGVFTTV